MELKHGEWVTKFGCNYTLNIDEANRVIIYPVEMRVSTIEQTIKHRRMPIYLPKHADTWSSEKEMENKIHTNGEFDPTCSAESGGFKQLIPRTSAGGGLKDIKITIKRKWRTEFYAPYFAKVRENDVLAMIAEWENAGEKGQFSAYTYIRDLYSLIQKSKDVKNDKNVSYVNEDSYTYMYIPDEVLYFDESITDKAFWLERILATSGSDSIQPEENLTMRNKRSVKTWQIVDYEKYDECIIKDADGNPTGNANVYALWPLGGYFGRSLYAFEANSSEKGNNKILSWGAYIGPGVHSGVDLYGRSNALRVYTNAFNSDGSAKIKAEYVSDEEIILSDGSSSIKIGKRNAAAGILGEDDEGVNDQNAHNEGEISGNRNVGAYMNTEVPINIDGTLVKFAGSSSAVYGYELYRLTKSYKDGEKAEAVIKEALEKEMYNTPVVAIAPGKVVGVKGGARPGFMVSIEHANGVTSNYLHMKRWPEVQEGEYVGAGTILGYEGTTGNSGGNHVHHEIATAEGDARYPIPQLYPFFAPFYYEDKASAVDYDLASEYMSITRTVFPYGQITKGNDRTLHYESANNQVGDMLQVEDKGNNEILIKNYVPTKILTTTNELLQDDTNPAEELKKKIRSQDKSISGEVVYNGEDVVALPQYFDKTFISKVLNNGGHILESTTTP
ncbi:MAG: M23 family metallopeptidase [Clostridia bacterium]|nr:M23 family metallopeptidase [Clostridia bacterium]